MARRIRTMALFTYKKPQKKRFEDLGANKIVRGPEEVKDENKKAKMAETPIQCGF
jgi:hypothetical protein